MTIIEVTVEGTYNLTADDRNDSWTFAENTYDYAVTGWKKKKKKIL